MRLLVRIVVRLPLVIRAMLGDSQSVKSYFLPLICVGIFAACFYPALEILVYKWSISEDYTHAFFVVPIIVYMIWQKRYVLSQNESSGIGLLLVVSFSCVYLLSLQIHVPAAMILATVMFVISCFVYIAGFKILTDLTIPIILIILIVPIPLQLLTIITGTLQLWVSETATSLIRFFAIPIFREGNVLHIAERSFQVVEACSGIRSLISMTTLSLIIGYFTLTRKRSLWMLFIVSIPIALIVNVVRVVCMVVAYHFFKLDITVGTSHTIAGLLLFGFGLVLLFAFQRVFEVWEQKRIGSY